MTKKILLFGLFSFIGNIAFSQEEVEAKTSTTIYEDLKNLINIVNPPKEKEKTTADILQEDREAEKIRRTPDPAVQNAKDRQEEAEPKDEKHLLKE